MRPVATLVLLLRFVRHHRLFFSAAATLLLLLVLALLLVFVILLLLLVVVTIDALQSGRKNANDVPVKADPRKPSLMVLAAASPSRSYWTANGKKRPCCTRQVAGRV